MRIHTQICIAFAIFLGLLLMIQRSTSAQENERITIVGYLLDEGFKRVEADGQIRADVDGRVLAPFPVEKGYVIIDTRWRGMLTWLFEGGDEEYEFCGQGRFEARESVGGVAFKIKRKYTSQDSLVGPLRASIRALNYSLEQLRQSTFRPPELISFYLYDATTGLALRTGSVTIRGAEGDTLSANVESGWTRFSATRYLRKRIEYKPSSPGYLRPPGSLELMVDTGLKTIIVPMTPQDGIFKPKVIPLPCVAFLIRDFETGTPINAAKIRYGIGGGTLSKAVSDTSGWLQVPFSKEAAGKLLEYGVQKWGYRARPIGTLCLQPLEQPAVVPMSIDRTTFSRIVDSKSNKFISLLVGAFGVIGGLYFDQRADEAYEEYHKLGYGSQQFDSAWSEVRREQDRSNIFLGVVGGTAAWLIISLGYSIML